MLSSFSGAGNWHEISVSCSAGNVFVDGKGVGLCRDYPASAFGPDSINAVGLTTDLAGSTDESGRWLETFPDSGVEPANLRKAQLKKRMSESTR